jgi:hypothetical protein
MVVKLHNSRVLVLLGEPKSWIFHLKNSSGSLRESAAHGVGGKSC